MQRVTVSMDESLAGHLDEYAAEKGYSSRSEAVRDLLRGTLSEWAGNRNESGYCTAVLSFVCDRSVRGMPMRLADLQHENHDLVVSTQSVPLTHHRSLETMILKGPIPNVRSLAAFLSSERGISFDAINLISVVPNDEHGHEGAHSHTGHLHLNPIIQ